MRMSIGLAAFFLASVASAQNMNDNGFPAFQPCTGSARILTAEEKGFDPLEDEGAPVFVNSGRTFEWEFMTYDVYEVSGAIAGDEIVTIAGEYVDGIDAWAVEHANEILEESPGITDLGLIFYPIGDDQYVVSQDVECLD